MVEAVREISALIRSDKLVLPENVEPIDRLPEVLLMLFDGKHTGNLVVRPKASATPT